MTTASKISGKGRAAQSFNDEEIDVVIHLMETLLRGGDASMIMKSRALNAVYTKFVRMRGKLR